jgi:glycosyltransferase involved in cell wall biosynthesis
LEIVVGIPAFNEEKNIASIILKLKKITNKIIVCNDGSSDLTNKIAEELGAIVINHSKNLGYGAAIRSIFLKAKEMNSDILVTFDADGQHQIEDIQNVVEPIMKKEADIVIGSRFLEENVKDIIPDYRKFGIKAITKLTNISINENLTDSQSGFRAYNNEVINKIHPTDQGMGISTEILIKASQKKFLIVEVPIKISYEGNTSTHNPVSHGASVIFSTLKFTSMDHPLKFYGIPGGILSIIGLFFIVWTIQYFTQFGNFPPVLALIAIGSTIVGIILLMNAILLYSVISIIKDK